MKKGQIQTINSYFDKVEQLFLSDRFSKICLYVLIIVFFILILILNRLYPLFADDWLYSFVHGKDERVENITDIFVSQYNHYLTWGGRSIVHLIAQFLLLVPSWIADILNSLAYICFTFLIYKFFSFDSKKENPLLFMLIQFIFWFLLPVFGETILWRTGSANYLWGNLIVFSFLYFYCRLFFKDEYQISRGGKLKVLTFFFFGVISGWTNENTAFAMIIGCIFILIWLKIKRMEIPAWAIAGIIGAIIGYLLMVLAPGNYIRYEQTMLIRWHFDSKIDLYIARSLMMLKALYHKVLPLLLAFSLSLVIFSNLNTSKDKQKQLFLSFFFLSLGFISFGVMIAAPIFPERVWFGIFSFFILAILQLLVIRNNRLLFQLQFILVIFLIFSYLFTYRQAAIELYEISSVLKDREHTINAQTNKKTFDLVATKKIHRSYGFSQLIEIPSDSTDWINQAYCKFYGIKSFRVDDPNDEDSQP